MIYAGTYPSNNDNNLSIDAWSLWNYADGQMIRVVCYTNAAKARLELNGKVVGAIKNYNEKTGVIYWDIPFASGKLEAIGLDNDNKEVSRYTINSSQQPYSLVIDEKPISIDKNGVAKVIVQVVDEKGNPVMLSDNEITCTLSGSGTLLGLEAGNNTDMGDYTDTIQRVFHGHLVAYIQANGTSNEPINVKFTSNWLKSTEVSIRVK